MDRYQIARYVAWALAGLGVLIGLTGNYIVGLMMLVTSITVSTFTQERISKRDLQEIEDYANRREDA